MKKLSFFLMAMLVSLTSFAAALGEGYEKVTNISTLAAGDKVVLYCDDSSIGVTGVNGTKDAAVAATGWVEYLVEAATGGVKLKDTSANKYISLTTKNTFTYKEEGSVCKINAEGVLGITLSGTDYFLYNNGGNYYRMYTDKTGNSSYKPFYVYKVVPVEVDPDATMYTVTVKSADETMGTVSGSAEYAEGSTATLEASPNPGYEFVNWSNGSTENPLKVTVTEDVTLTATFQAQTPITIAEALVLTDGAACVLNPFTVVYVNGSYIYVEDESAYALAYNYNYGLVAGDKVTGLAVTKSTYNGIAQLVPASAYADLTIVAGEAPAIDEVTTAPTVADNHLVKLMNVKMEGEFTTAAYATLVATCEDGTTINIYNNKLNEYTFVAEKTYNITGGVTQYKNVIQIQAYEIEEYVAPVVNHTITVSANPAEAGTVTGAGEYEEGAEATLTATAAEGYEFVNWTSGETEVSTANPFTFTVTSDTTLVANFTEVVVEPTEVTVYCINSSKWDVVACHHWVEGGSTTSWPGDVMTKTEETVNGFDVYAATFTIEHTSCIFNNNNNGSQTGNLTVENGHYYYVKDAKWYASLADVPALDPLATDVYLAGEMNEWSTVANEFRKTTEDATTASLTLTLEAATTYEFKVVKEGAWFGNNGTITASVEGWTFNTDDGNCKLTTDAAGEYVLTWDLNTNKLTVTYPEPTPTVALSCTGMDKVYLAVRDMLQLEGTSADNESVVVSLYNYAATVGDYQAFIAFGDLELETESLTINRGSEEWTLTATIDADTAIYEFTATTAAPKTETIAPRAAIWGGDAMNGYIIDCTTTNGEVQIVLMDGTEYGMGWMLNLAINDEILVEGATIDAPTWEEDNLVLNVTVVSSSLDEYTINLTATPKPATEITVAATMALSEDEYEVGTMIVSATWGEYPLTVKLNGWPYYGYGEYAEANLIIEIDPDNYDIIDAYSTATIEKKEDAAVLTGTFSDWEGNKYALTLTIAEPAAAPVVDTVTVVCTDMTQGEEWGTPILTGTCDLGNINISLYLEDTDHPESVYGEYGFADLFPSVEVTIEGEDSFIMLELLENTVAVYTDGETQDSFVGTFLGSDWKIYVLDMKTSAPEGPSALDNVTTTVAPVKAIVNGQLVIVKDGVQYNAQGAVVK